MAVQSGLCLALLETPSTGFVVTRLFWVVIAFVKSDEVEASSMRGMSIKAKGPKLLLDSHGQKKLVAADSSCLD